MYMRVCCYLLAPKGRMRSCNSFASRAMLDNDVRSFGTSVYDAKMFTKHPVRSIDFFEIACDLFLRLFLFFKKEANAPMVRKIDHA